MEIAERREEIRRKQKLPDEEAVRARMEQKAREFAEAEAAIYPKR